MATGKYLEVDPGIEIYYEDQGEGTPIIFITGWTFTTEMFSNQMAHFSSSHRAIAMDPRSHGRSTVTPHGNNYETQGADLAKLITALDLKEVVLVGWSVGILTTLSYVRQYGLDNVKAVVSIDMSPKPLSCNDDDWVEGPFDETAELFTTYLFTPQGQRDFVTAYATEVMVQRELEEEELTWILEQSLNTPSHLAALYFAAAMFADYRAEAQLVSKNVPALYVIAEHWADVAVPYINTLCPETETAVLGGHMMFWEHAGKFNARLDEFLASL
ncbi:MAG: alpha/beta hydrolase [Anaerolineae bacterium]|nr:alpha/beta hydrolase [Anaerolineae bacterium]